MMLRYIPDHFMSVDSKTRVVETSSVQSIDIIPPSGRRPGDAPIVQSMTLVRVHLANNRVRHFGTQRAWINDTLRVVIEINPRDEVLRGWDAPMDL